MRFTILATLFATIATLALATPAHLSESGTTVVPAGAQTESSALVLESESRERPVSLPSHHNPSLIRRQDDIPTLRAHGRNQAALARTHTRTAATYRQSANGHTAAGNHEMAAIHHENANQHELAATKAGHMRDGYRAQANMEAAHNRANAAQTQQQHNRHMATANNHFNNAMNHFEAAGNIHPNV